MIDESNTFGRRVTLIGHASFPNKVCKDCRV